MRFRYFLLFSLFHLTAIASFAQNEDTQSLIKDIKKIIKKESLVKDRLDWEQLDLQLKSLDYSSDHALDKELVFDVFVQFLNQAGDNHSLFLSNQVKKVVDEIKALEVYPTSKFLGNGIGYLLIPSCLNFDAEKDRIFADTIIAQIQKLDEFEIENWIIDLRGNRGGNGWPMLAGLIPIIGEGVVGYNLSPKKDIPQRLEAGTIRYANVNTKVYSTKKNYRKIAVLIDEKTGSSGEMVAISLLGFENSKSFGQKTADFTTSNSSFSFSNDNALLFLATGMMADKNKRTYQGGIVPDIPLANELSEKEKIDRIIEWLSKD